MNKSNPLLLLLWVAGMISASSNLRGQVVIQFDYSLDTGGFFADASRKALLETAATALTSRLGDTLSAITPGGDNNWSISLHHPGTGNSTSVSNPTIPANTLIIYAGGMDLPPNVLGQGGPGGFSGSGTSDFYQAASTRGQTGAPATEFGPWGGSITFDTPSNWYFDTDVTSVDVPSGRPDFYSVAVHELAHVLGIGTSTSWNNKVSGGNFTGANSVAAHGGNVPVNAGGDHWAEGTTSTLPGTLTSQEAAMDPSITLGSRKFMTTLDFAGLADVGWTVTPVPEPEEVTLATSGLLVFCALIRRAMKNRKGQPSEETVQS